MAVQGVFASDQNIVANRKGDFASALLRVNPSGSAPLLALSAGMQTKPAVDTIVNWFEEVKITGRLNIASFVTDGDGVGIVVDDASSIIPGVVLLNEDTGEYVLVTVVVPSTNTITVTRGIGGTTATTMTASHFLFRVGTGFEEGSALPTAVANLGDVRFNITQIFRNSWSVTGTTKAIQYHTGSQVAKSKADCAFFHAEDIERALIWGRKHVGTLNTQPFRLMDGIKQQITNHGGLVEAQSTDMKWFENIVPHFQTIFEKNIKGKPNERIAFCGNSVINVINRLAILNGEIKLSVGQTDFGLNVTTLITPFGTVKLMTHPLMVENPFFTEELYTLHPGALRTRWLRNTQIEGYDTNGKRIDGADADQGVYTSELCVELTAAQTAGILTGVNTAAADA